MLNSTMRFCTLFGHEFYIFNFVNFISCLLLAQFSTKLLETSLNVVVAEWLRRWTRNPLGSSRAGSNPADNDRFFSVSK